MRVDFWGLLPEGAGLFPGDYLDATGRLAEIFGFTRLAHLTVRDGENLQGDKPEPADPDELARLLREWRARG